MRPWKKASSLILAVALCFCLLPVQAADAGGDQGSSGSGPVFHSFKSLPLTLQSNQVGISVNTTRTDAYSGDVISFEVVMDPVQNLGTLQLVLDIPEGLSYVPDSACVPDDLKTTLGFDELAFTELSLMLNGYASAGNYSAETETLLLTFDCKADDTVTAQATVNVSLTNLEFYSIGEDEEDWLDLTDSFEVIPAPLTLHPGTHTHSYTGTVTTPASCTTAGIKTYVCACGERYTEDVPALGHTWDAGVITTQPTTTTEGVKTFTCTVCHETKTESVPKLEIPVESDVTFTLGTTTGRAGDTVRIDLYVSGKTDINTIGLKTLTYDTSVLTFKGFVDPDNLISGSLIPSGALNDAMGTITLMYSSSFKPDGRLCSLEFVIKEDIEEAQTVVSMESLVRNGSTVISSNVVSGEVIVTNELLGDLNGDNFVDVDDVVMLLQYSIFPELYPLEYYRGSVDFNKDGFVDVDDVVMLLQYSIFPDLYPLN